ncbi:sulfotransferase family protein [Roseibium sp.]|uniref:sulfotransferase family protein n=1 Tax=Roseibium sp. TaxID=1936156 RepID=UPI003A986F15
MPNVPTPGKNARTAEKDPILIVGCQRSGTTLLRTILNTHEQIAIGYECDYFEVLAKTFGDTIDIWTHVDRYLDDLFSVNRFEFWNLTRDEVYAAFEAAQKPISYPKSIRLICNAYCHKHKPGAILCGVKNPNSIERLGQFFEIFPVGRAVHIIRDPRASFASEKKKLTKRDGRFNSFLNTIRVALRWNRAVKAQDAFEGDSRVFPISYWDLIVNTEQVLRTLCTWLEVPFDPNILEYYKTADTPEKELWQHSLTRQPPSKERLSAYLEELTPVEIACINFLCRDHIKKYSDGQRTDYRMRRILPALSIGWAQWFMSGVPRKIAFLWHEAFRRRAS